MSHINSYFGTETLSIELKEFCLNSLNLFFDNLELPAIINSQNYIIDPVIFNKCVSHDLSLYIINYLPKYVCNFIASKINGQLYFGISDTGIRESIPYFGDDLPMDLINSMVKQCFNLKIRPLKLYSESDLDGSDVGADVGVNGGLGIGSNIEPNIELQWVQNNIKITVEKLTINELLLDNDHISRYEHLTHTYAKRKAQYKLYIDKYKQWHDELLAFNIKLKTMINNLDIRKKIIQFMKTEALAKNMDLSEYSTALEYFESDVLIDYDITNDTLNKQLDINNYNNHFTWLLLFKDYILNTIKHKKPKEPPSRPSDINYYGFFKHMSNIKNYLIKNSCNFFTIRFDIPLVPFDTIFEYKTLYDKWICKKRSINDYGPFTEEL